MIARESIPVWGFTRTPDLYLHIPDGASRYFRAQAGLDRSNRLHVTDLMGLAAGVKVSPADWEARPTDSHGRAGVVCHLGASHKENTWPATSWVALAQRLVTDGVPVTFIGSEAERAMADDVALQVTLGQPSGRAALLHNRVGQTNFQELLDVLSKSALFIGADSAPLHAAALAGCRALNLSVGDVRFWETGPIIPGSRVLVSREPSFLPSDTVYTQSRDMLAGLNSRRGYIECVAASGGPLYVVHPEATCPADFWDLVRWIHFDGPKPRVGGEITTALSQITEICAIACSQLETYLKSPENNEVVNVLDRLDDLLEIFRVNIKPLAPLMEEFRAQKENIPPGPRDEVFFQTAACYKRLLQLAEDLRGDVSTRPLAAEAKG